MKWLAPLAVATLSACARPAARPVSLRPPPALEAWIEDDYPAALARAKATGEPLFVDASAVWCHTCKAMRAYVLDDPSLPRGFVRLSFDVEKEKNAAAAAAFPVHVLPTFFVVDPRDGSIHGRWEGAGTVKQLRAFLNDASRSIALAHSSRLDPNDPFALLLSGQRAAMHQDLAGAAGAFERALALAPRAWDRAPEAMLGLAEAERHDPEACAKTAERGLGPDLDRLGRSSVLADFAEDALDCVERSTDGAAQTRVRKLVATRIAALARDSSAPLSPDDRSDAWRIVWAAREALGDHAGALDAARARLGVLERAVAARPDPAIATTFDGARMETLEFLGRDEDAARFLEEREKTLPDDYNPPHRLARVYFDSKRYPAALAAIRRALAKGYGARKGLMLRLEADILVAMGRKTEALAALEEQLALYRALPAGQKRPAYEKAVLEHIAKLKSAP